MSVLRLLTLVCAFGAVTATVEGQTPPVAIVGARIVDGSGNEPFTGTIVLEAGRIKAVGRSVEAPEGATVVDGSGHTVLPGLIDVRAPLGSSADAAEQQRALARVLLAGITTLVVPDVDAARLDELRRSPEPLPRLVSQGSGSLTVAANVEQLQGASARPNPTVALQLPAEAAAAAAMTKAAQDAHLRLAAAAIGFGDEPHAGLRALVAAGVSPLDAVTAATSGGAWALGLQSDRGFLAPGMRADILVVEGDPTADIKDLSRIDRLYLGGVEVDRNALRERATPPPTPSPTAEPAAPPATPATSASGKTEETGRAAAESSTAPARAPRGRRRGARATDTPPPADTSKAVESTADPAPPAAAPADPDPAAAPAAAGVRPASPLIDDFERGEGRSAIGPAWTMTVENGERPTTAVMGHVVRGLRDHALHLTARMGAAGEPFARASIVVAENGRPLDVSRFRGIRFEARGEGRYRVVFVTRAVTDGRYHESYFSGSPLWTPVSIPFASTGQNGQGTRVPWTGRDLVEIRFEVARDPGRLAWLELDNLHFY